MLTNRISLWLAFPLSGLLQGPLDMYMLGAGGHFQTVNLPEQKARLLILEDLLFSFLPWP